MIIVNSIIGELKPPWVEFTHSAVDAVDRLSYTFSSVPIGDASPRRTIILATMAGGWDTCTVGGVALTERVVSGYVSLWTGVVPTGTTATIAFSRSSVLATSGRIFVWAAYNLDSSTPTDTAIMSGTALSPQSIDVDARGIIVAAAATNGNATWTSISEDGEVSSEGVNMSGASTTSQSGGTVSIGLSQTGSPGVPSAVIASFR